jgi:hypothetical protein
MNIWILTRKCIQVGLLGMKIKEKDNSSVGKLQNIRLDRVVRFFFIDDVRGPSIDATYHVSVHLAKRFRSRRFLGNEEQYIKTPHSHPTQTKAKLYKHK